MAITSEAQTERIVTPRRVKVLGYFQGPAPDPRDCESPLSVMIGDYGPDGEPLPWRHEIWRCSGHRSSRCRPCAKRYQLRVREVALDGMFRARGFFYFLTLTAPGADRHRYGRSGKFCTCTPVGGVDLAVWNPTAAKCWNRFLLGVERRYKVRPRYFRSAEVQGRGALHAHVLIHSARKLSPGVLRDLAVQAGFGHEVKLIPFEPGSKDGAKFARYVSKYVTKSANNRELVPWRRLEPTAWDGDTGEVLDESMVDSPATFRTWSQSRSWGSTMKAIRDVSRRRWQEKQAAAAAAAGGHAPGSGCGFGPAPAPA